MPHAYVSTACMHGIHDQCRKECKFCKAPCGCACHEADALQPLEVRGGDDDAAQ